MRLRAEKPRVFCIGWHKTGTTSMGTALLALGYRVLGCRLDMVHPLRNGDIDSVIDVAADFDALQDVPWAALYRELDQRFPGSKFILTERDEEKWLASASRHFAGSEIPLHGWLYGSGRLLGNEELYLNRYRRHYIEVKEYFNGRDSDLLTLDLERGDGWPELCRFLDASAPSSKFPHINKGPQTQNAMDRFMADLRRVIPLTWRKAFFHARLRAKSALGMPDSRNRFNNLVENRRERKKWKKIE
jgi:hypothetical protein